LLHKLDLIATGPRVSVYRIPAAEIVYCLIAPVITVLIFNISIINQYGYVDPEFYTGYGYSFSRMWHVYGPTYYAMRFPIMFLNSFFQGLGPGLFGYTLLRLLILWACGIPLYLSVRRLYGIWVAVVAYACLCLNPFFARLLLWDLTIFVSIPAALAGIAVWHLREQRSLLAATMTGFFLCVSVNSHAFTGTAVGLFVLTELIFALVTARGRRGLLVDGAGLALGSLVCMGLGLAFYWLHVGYVSPLTLLHVTLAAIKVGNQYVQSSSMPFSSYFATNYDIYVPFITTALAARTLRSSLLQNTVQARITWFAILYCAAYLFAVFIRHMFIAQTFYYFSHLTIIVYLTVPIILGEVARISTWLRAVSCCIGLVLPLVVARIDGPFIMHLNAAVAGATQVVVAIGAATCFIAIVLAYGRRCATIAGITAFLLFGLLVQIPFLVPVYSYMYIDNPTRSVEVPLYAMIRQYHMLLNERDKPGQRVLTWYVIDHYTFSSLASSNLLLTLHNPWVAPGGMPAIGQYERDRLADGQYKYVLLIDSDRAIVDRGLDALAEAGVRVERIEEHVWGEPPLTAYALLVQLIR
jgi:hypothetical protein